MAERTDVTQRQALQAVVDHNRAAFDLEESHVFLTIDPMSARIPRGGDFWLTVSSGAGSFDEGMMMGAIVEQCMERTDYTVSGFVRLHLDQTDSDEQLLANEDYGLLEVKRQILVANAGQDILYNGLEFLREIIAPVSAGDPMLVSPMGTESDREDLQIGVISVTFSMVFDWYLGS